MRRTLGDEDDNYMGEELDLDLNFGGIGDNTEKILVEDLQ